MFEFRYEVGSSYETEDCKKCTCKLNGILECSLKQCHTKCDSVSCRIKKEHNKKSASVLKK